jgi:hypothetical protein
MKKSVKIVGRMVAVAALLALGAGAAQAQNWPVTSPLHCNWTLSSGGTVTGGTSTITFSYNYADSYVRRGYLTTTYPNGSSTVKPITLTWDWSASHADTFVFQQTQDNITCSSTRTFDAGSIAVFDLCSNGAFQYCRP